MIPDFGKTGLPLTTFPQLITIWLRKNELYFLQRRPNIATPHLEKSFKLYNELGLYDDANKARTIAAVSKGINDARCFFGIRECIQQKYFASFKIVFSFSPFFFNRTRNYRSVHRPYTWIRNGWLKNDIDALSVEKLQDYFLDRERPAYR